MSLSDYFNRKAVFDIFPLETADVGIDLATPVVESIGSEAKSKFTGRIPKVTVEVKEMKNAEKALENKLRAETTHKKVMAD